MNIDLKTKMNYGSTEDMVSRNEDETQVMLTRNIMQPGNNHKSKSYPLATVVLMLCLLIAVGFTGLALSGREEKGIRMSYKNAKVDILVATKNEKVDMLGAATTPGTSCKDAIPVTMNEEALKAQPLIAQSGPAVDGFKCDPDCCSYTPDGSYGRNWFRFDGSVLKVPQMLKATTSIGEDESDHMISVFSGTCEALECAPSAGNPSPGSWMNIADEATWCASPGQTYYIMVEARDFEDDPTFLFNVESAGPCLSPENDICANAESLEVGESYFFNNIGATDESIAECGGTIFGGTWFSVTPEDNGVLEASICSTETTLEAQVYVFWGDCSKTNAMSLECLAHNSKTDSNDCDGDNMLVSPVGADWCAKADTTYYVAVGGHTRGQGNFALTINRVGSCVADVVDGPGTKCKEAIEMELSGETGESGTVKGSTTGDTTGMPLRDLRCGKWEQTHTRWSKVTAPDFDSVMTASTWCGVEFDSVIDVYKGKCKPTESRECVGYNNFNQNVDAEDCEFGSFVSWCANANTDYFLAVGGYSEEDHGPYQLEVTATNDPCPSNTNCDNAVEVGVGDIVDDRNFVSSRQEQPTGCGTQGSYNFMSWYVIETPPDGAGSYSVSTCFEDYTDIHTQIWIMEGSCDSLMCKNYTVVSTDHSPCGQTKWCAKANQQYTIAVGGDEMGKFRFKIEHLGKCDPPSNEVCSNALSATGCWATY